MADSLVAVTEGSGKNFATWSRTVNASTVEGQIVLDGEPYLPTYSVVASSISTATSASHILQLMAGSTNYVRIQKITIKQVTDAGAAAMAAIQLLRLTSAGTGGSVVTPRPYDIGDTPDSTAMTLPSAKGTEGVQLDLFDFPLRAATVAAEQQLIWTPPRRGKPIIIQAGTTNGLAFKIVTGRASATISLVVTLLETPWL